MVGGDKLLSDRQTHIYHTPYTHRAPVRGRWETAGSLDTVELGFTRRQTRLLCEDDGGRQSPFRQTNTHTPPPPHTHTHTEFQLQDGGGPAGRYGGVGMGRETNSSLVSLFVQATNGPLVESFEYHFRQTAAARLALHVGYVQSHENVIYNVDAVSSLIHDFLTNTRRQNACLLYTSPSPRDSGISRMPSSA